MSNPEGGNQTATQQPNVDSTLESKVKAVIGQFSTDDSGKITFPDELKKTVDADTLYAATLEHRRRSTQSGYTSGQQKQKSLEAQNAELLKQLGLTTKVVISEEDQTRLDKLKYDNPDQWYKELTQLTNAAAGESRAKLTELTGEVGKAADVKFELDRRQTVLDEFNASAKVAITAELIANDVPPRITAKLEAGTITWEGYLQEIETYVTTGKVVKNEDTLKQPNMGEMGGRTDPSDTKPEKSLSENYGNDIY